jgi:hypothetical protein
MWSLVIKKWCGIALSVLVLGVVSPTKGQSTGLDAFGGGAPRVNQAPTRGGALTRDPLNNPFVTPSNNPYLNPYLSTTTMSSDAALYYLLAAQRQSGGIGSGMLSGVRQAEMGTTAPRASTPNTTGPYAGQAATRYFQRGQGRFAGTNARYFQRTSPLVGR